MPDRRRSLHNHTDGEVRGCILDLGHSGQHLSADRVRWQRANVPQVVRLGLGARMDESADFNCVVGGEKVVLRGSVHGTIGPGPDVKWSA